MTQINTSRLPECFAALGQTTQMRLADGHALPSGALHSGDSISAAPIDFLADIRRMRAFRGLFSNVARQLGVTPEHVRFIALGDRTSPRVMVALEREYRRIQKELGEFQERPIDFLADIRRMRAFRGLFSNVARQLGVTRGYVHVIAAGDRTSPRAMVALEREYRRIQKELGEFQDRPAEDDTSHETPAPSGSMDDSSVVRGVLIQAIRKSGKTRAQIAEEISFLSGRALTEISLNKFTAESRTDYRWPAELDRAFCQATGDNTLLRCRVELAGLHVIDSVEADLLDLGREIIRQKRAAAKVAILERRLGGIEL